jgi:hypothetical protein
VAPRHPRDRPTRRCRERTTAVAALTAVLALAAGCAESGRPVSLAPAAAEPAPSPTAAPAASSEPAEPVRTTEPAPVVVPITYPTTGSQNWSVAKGNGAVAGTAGPLRRYRVAVEKDIEGVTASAFADVVEATLGDRRSWAGSDRTRLQRVGRRTEPDFTVYLATPATRDQLCGDAAAGQVDQYTSCRNGASVVLNVARWTEGAPAFRASLRTYRTYMINHEVGHALGHGHETCPGAGRPAPVMQQQTLGLHGCRPNGWPNRKNGTAYHGPPGAYGDPVPDVR